jgi:hypothetical protein
MQLFHFSEGPGIEIFTPRPVLFPARRAAGREWLNGPLVWAIDDWHQPMYLFPRDCPRILIWPTDQTTAEDYERYWSPCTSRMIAFVERQWMSGIRSEIIYRYELPEAPFLNLQDAGMWVSKTPVRPLEKVVISDMVAALELHHVELRPMDSLARLRGLWNTSLHTSGIRLRNAASWNG